MSKIDRVLRSNLKLRHLQLLVAQVAELVQRHQQLQVAQLEVGAQQAVDRGHRPIITIAS